MAGMGMPMGGGMPPMDPAMGGMPPGGMVQMLAAQLGQQLSGEQAKIAGAEQVAMDGLMMALEAFAMPEPGFAEGAPVPAGPPVGGPEGDPMLAALMMGAA